jgi:hypothetical protein
VTDGIDFASGSCCSPQIRQSLVEGEKRLADLLLAGLIPRSSSINIIDRKRSPESGRVIATGPASRSKIASE